jgi:hypothetical protein
MMRPPHILNRSSKGISNQAEARQQRNHQEDKNRYGFEGHSHLLKHARLCNPRANAKACGLRLAAACKKQVIEQPRLARIIESPLSVCSNARGWQC